MTGNLPDDVTGYDIDRHYGSPDKVRVMGSVSVGVDTEVYAEASKEEMKQALRDELKDQFDHVLDAEIGEVEPL